MVPQGLRRGLNGLGRGVGKGEAKRLKPSRERQMSIMGAKE